MEGASAFKQRGGKLIHYHGWADPALTPLMTVNYFERVLNYMGVQTTSEFYKLYMVPGMFHCSGGVACWDATSTVLDSNSKPILNQNANQMQFFNAVVDWVELGKKPDTFVGTRTATATGLTARTRPFCPYPEVARYTGTGSTDDAANFICVPPVEVSIDPTPLYLHSDEMFFADITLPKGFEARDWGIRDVVCEGAHAVGGFLEESVHTPTYSALFRTSDLVGVMPGNRGHFQGNTYFPP